MSDEKKKSPNGQPKTGSTRKPLKSQGSKDLPHDEPTFNTILGADDKKSKQPDKSSQNTNKGVSRTAALTMSVMAALAGGAIGWGGPTFFGGQDAKNAAMEAALQQTRADLATAQAEQKNLAESLATIQGTSRSQATSNQSIAETLATLEDDIQALRDSQPTDSSETLAALEERISKMATLTLPTSGEGEDGEPVTVDIINLVERIDSLEAGGSDEITARLTDLETQIAELNVKPVSFPEPDPTPIELPPEETAQSAEETLQVLIDTFPRAKMLESVEAQKALAAEKPSWLQRVLSRHVKTHDEQTADPVETINAAQTALERGEVTQALALIGELNPPVRAVAADWIGAAKKAAKRIEKDF